MRRLACILLFVLSLQGCALIGPAVIRGGRSAYNDTIVATNNQQVLAVIVRTRYGEPSGLLAVSSITSNMKFQTNAGAEFGFGSETDYKGNLESGFALAVTAMIRHLVPERKKGPGAEPTGLVNVLVSSQFTPGDVEELETMIEGFGLTPVILPNIGDALDGHLIEQESSPLTVGGTPLGAVEELYQADATLVIGDSMKQAADLLHEKTGVPDYRFTHLLGLDAVDEFVATLHQISGQPARVKRTSGRTIQRETISG